MKSLVERIAAPLRDRRITNRLRHALDEWLPPVVREWRPLNSLLVGLFHGPGFDLDFKEKAFRMSAREVADAYAALDAGVARYRDSDTTPEQARLIAAEVEGSVLEVGCGNGGLTATLRARGHHVVACDLAIGGLVATRARAPGVEVVAASLPSLPFADGAFDTVVCSHTLEHVVDLWASARELRRVARRKVVIVVPRQRYYRYTVDYHLHFFPSAAPLEALVEGEARAVDGDWLVIAPPLLRQP